MSDHSQISDLLPLYVSGVLDGAQRLAVEKHLAGCAECRSDLALWKLTAVEVEDASVHAAPPRQMAERVLARVVTNPPARTSSTLSSRLAQAWLLLRTQMPLVHREIWPASAGVIGMGCVMAVIAAQSGFVYALAPLLAAACVSLITGPENDPAFELALSTPTSPRQILLARLALVFGYNLALVLAATLVLLPLIPVPMMSVLALTWLAPMTFLSVAALLLSLWIGATNAISITYIAWLAQLIAGPLRSQPAGLGVSPAVARVMDAYQSFWQSPALLLALSVVLFAAAVWMAGRQQYAAPHTA